MVSLTLILIIANKTQETDGYNWIVSYSFLHDTDTFTPTDNSHDFSDKYYNYIDNNYIEFDVGFSLTHMRKLTDKDIAIHIKEIDSNVIDVNFNKIYSYEHRQMVTYQFEHFPQGIMDADPSCMFQLSCYIHMGLYKDYVFKCCYTANIKHHAKKT